MKAPELKAPELKAHEFDRAFDAGEDVSGHVDWPQARRVNLEARRVNVDFPAWVVDALDREARLQRRPAAVAHQALDCRTAGGNLIRAPSTQPPPRRNCDPGPITPSRRERPLRAPLPVEEGDSAAAGAARFSP